MYLCFGYTSLQPGAVKNADRNILNKGQIHESLVLNAISQKGFRINEKIILSLKSVHLIFLSLIFLFYWF